MTTNINIIDLNVLRETSDQATSLYPLKKKISLAAMQGNQSILIDKVPIIIENWLKNQGFGTQHYIFENVPVEVVYWSDKTTKAKEGWATTMLQVTRNAIPVLDFLVTLQVKALEAAKDGLRAIKIKVDDPEFRHRLKDYFGTFHKDLIDKHLKCNDNVITFDWSDDEKPTICDEKDTSSEIPQTPCYKFLTNE